MTLSLSCSECLLELLGYHVKRGYNYHQPCLREKVEGDAAISTELNAVVSVSCPSICSGYLNDRGSQCTALS